ncbi:hypothetical protein [Amycolatopsis suaedae]|uniref:Uncharacterized protein n=1 Tax=Amycolatopsis suaedae TaxID=2510978 RepID=A0A4Q7JCJ9_9PSEU|nr:hypothetical protein [Amycolatopsis suaedae]RZQ65027.1 hypothetical protein EWH70_03750 [Amycolatopsis suaedae]
MAANKLPVPLYFEYYNKTFRIDETPDGGLIGRLYNRSTGRFEPRTDLIHKVLFATSTPEISRLNENDFIDETEQNRAMDLRGDGPIFALYETIDGLYDQAKSENRPLGPDELALMASLRKRTFRMWEEEFARRDAGEPPSFEYRSELDR